MNASAITIANEKGQVVIPKPVRDKIGIRKGMLLKVALRGNGVYLYPITDILTAEDRDESYLKVLERTQGAWADDKGWARRAGIRRKRELAAARRLKHAW